MSEFASQHEASSLEKLQLLEFSFITRPNRLRTVDPDRIIGLDKLPFEQRVIDLAYYALELSTRKLKPFDYAHSQLETMEPGTDKAIAIIDDVIIAMAVRAEITKSLNLYDPRLHDLIAQETAQYTPDSVGWLKAIYRMRNADDRRKRIGQQTGRSSEAVARLTIAREKGIQIPFTGNSQPASVE